MDILATLIQNYGLIAICLIIFAETGLLVGVFLPGDTLLFLAGIYSAKGAFPLWELIVFVSIAAILGDSSGYYIGRKLGKEIFTKGDNFIFSRKRLKSAADFYEKHGSKTLIAARFIGFLRTFAPVIAGVVKMKYHTFLKYNIVGAVLWVIFISLLGYFLGSKFAPIINYLDLAVLVISLSSVVIAIIAGILRLVKNRRTTV